MSNAPQHVRDEGAPARPDGRHGAGPEAEGGDPTGPRDMTGASREEIADLVDDLEEKVLAEAGNPQDETAEEGRASGTDRSAEDAEPPV